MGASEISSAGKCQGPGATVCAKCDLKSATPSPVRAQTMKVAEKATRALHSCARVSRRSFFTRSILLRTSRGGVRVSCNRPRMRSASSSRSLAASISRATMSASVAPLQAASTMARSSRRRGAKMPGVSMNTSWLAPSTAMPRTRVRVVCTLRLTMLTLAPTSVLTSVDLPAFGAPMMAMKPQRVSATGPTSLIGASAHTFAGEKGRGRRLLGGALAGALATGRFGALDANFGREAGRVIGSLARHLHVLRQLEALALGPLLQCRLGVGGLGRRAFELGTPMGAHHITRLRVAGLQEHRPEQGLAGIGQDRLFVAATGTRFRFAQMQRGTKIEGACHLCARTAAHQAIEKSGELTFGRRGKGLAQQFGDGKTQHAVPEEFEALVVAAFGRSLTHAGVSERLLQERTILEHVAEAGLQLLELANRRHCLAHEAENPTPPDVEGPGPGARQLEGVGIVNGGGEEDDFGAPDEVLKGHVAHAVARRLLAAVGGVVAVVAHHEVVTGRHLVAADVVELSTLDGIQHEVFDAVEQRFLVPRDWPAFFG